MAKSIIQSDETCYLCGSQCTLEIHHCLHGTANRKLADADGLTVYLCRRCHMNLHDKGWHDRDLQRVAETVWCNKFGKTTEEFIKRYGKSYQ